MTRQPDEDEPYHRRWLHALEDDRTVPGTPMQVGRIFADYAPSKGGRAASVSYAVLQHQTHRSRDALDDAITYLVAHGWLTPLPHENGQRITYALTFGEAGPQRKPVRQAERSVPRNQSGSRNGRTANQSGQRTGSRQSDQSGSRNATSPASGTEPVRPAERERLTSVTSLSEVLVGIVSGATDATSGEARETVALILEDRKPDSPPGYFRMLAKNGDLGLWLDKIRNGPGEPASITDSAGTPSAPRLATLCSWCSRPGHDQDACPERAALSRDPDSDSRQAADPAPIEEQGEGREEFTRKLAAMKTRAAERARVPAGAACPDESRDGGHAA